MGKKEKQSFKAPEGYFDNFNERLMQRMQEEEAEKALTFLPKTDGFTVPQAYFEEVEDSIKDRLGKRDTPVIQLQPYRKWAYGAAAIAAGFLLFFGLNLSPEDPVAFEDLASAEIDAYLDHTELDLSTYELAEMVSLDDTSLNNLMETPLESENILEYLDENIEDIEELNLNFEDYE